MKRSFIVFSKYYLLNHRIDSLFFIFTRYILYFERYRNRKSLCNQIKRKIIWVIGKINGIREIIEIKNHFDWKRNVN